MKQSAKSQMFGFKTRRKAEEDRLRKEEEKTRRELIKQEYLRRKQQEMFEEQGLVKPKTPKVKQKHKPKSVLREESSSDHFSKCSSTRETVTSLLLHLAKESFLYMSCWTYWLTVSCFQLF